jgi:hypothetical protein
MPHIAQAFDVLDQQLGGVVAALAQRRRLAGAALVEQDHAVLLGIEEAAMLRRQAGARAAVQSTGCRPDCRLPPSTGMQVVDRQHAVTAGAMGGNRAGLGSNMAIL